MGSSIMHAPQNTKPEVAEGVTQKDELSHDLQSNHSEDLQSNPPFSVTKLPPFNGKLFDQSDWEQDSYHLFDFSEQFSNLKVNEEPENTDPKETFTPRFRHQCVSTTKAGTRCSRFTCQPTDSRCATHSFLQAQKQSQRQGSKCPANQSPPVEQSASDTRLTWGRQWIIWFNDTDPPHLIQWARKQAFCTPCHFEDAPFRLSDIRYWKNFHKNSPFQSV